MILECYLAAFAKTCHPAGGWFGLDAFAGLGLNWSEARDAEILGSPLIALEAGSPQATKVLLCEKYDRTRRALTARCAPYGSRVEIFAGDINSEIRRLLVEVPRKAPAFAFLDPEGADVDWATVRDIARHKDPGYTRIEQLILFPTDMGFMRLLDLAQTNEPGAQRVGRLFHTETWRDIWDARAARQLSADEARTEYVKLYAAGLRELGYATVLDRRVPARGRRQYFLLFARTMTPAETSWTGASTTSGSEPRRSLLKASCFGRLILLGRGGFDSRHLVPRPPVELSPAGLRGAASPLLEEEGGPGLLAVVAEIAHPLGITPAVLRSRLAPSDQPVDAGQVELRSLSHIRAVVPSPSDPTVE
jgi:three-Cys-motif partner protein